ncbi:helix-turn-helix domain-containing protein [Lactococcus petauri]|uniref:helix-turn-helix domain-containing protein n=1 Tax=Lactococcus petauri TaxID=1940789 RepID=UPI0031FF3CA0
MTVLERIKELAKKRDTTIKDLSKYIGLSENSIYRWKETNPKAADLEKVADYFHVTVDYLLGREELSVHVSDSDLSRMLEGAEAYNGQPMTESDKEAIRMATEMYLLGKYGPKK